MMLDKYYLPLALLIYVIVAVATLFRWEMGGVNSITGDEPHYLVMASGIINELSLEQTKPYLDEFKNRDIYQAGLATENAIPSALNTHAVLGPNGLYNVHNVGLPILLATPYFLGGVIGAKIFMVLVSSLAIVALWRCAAHAPGDVAYRFWAVIATTVAMPLVPGSSQIYPEIVAGLCSLVALGCIANARSHGSIGVVILVSCAIAFLPWLQIKYSATALVLMLMLSYKIHAHERDLKKTFFPIYITGASLFLLGAYNNFAFGSYYGPYHLWQTAGLEVSKQSFMVLLGLHLDQNQGFLFQNPINLIGLVGVGLMYTRDRFTTLGFLLVFSSLIVPNGLHPTWYGGWSFSGRFGWSAAIVFMMPTLYALLHLSNKHRRLFAAIIVLSLTLQVYFFWLYAILGMNIFNKSPNTWYEAYSIFYYPVHSWLPMLYDLRWAGDYTPNYAWSALVLALVIAGGIRNNALWEKSRTLIFTPILLAIGVGGLNAEQADNTEVFLASQLPSNTGRQLGTARVVEKNIDQPGFVNFGPYFPLRKGEYLVEIRYQSPAEIFDVIGSADVFNARSHTKLLEIPIKGTAGQLSTLTMEFNYSDWAPGNFEFRTHWNGKSELIIEDIVLSGGS